MYENMRTGTEERSEGSLTHATVLRVTVTCNTSLTGYSQLRGRLFLNVESVCAPERPLEERCLYVEKKALLDGLTKWLKETEPSERKLDENTRIHQALGKRKAGHQSQRRRH